MQGVTSDALLAELADATLLELRRLQCDEVAAEDFTPLLFVLVDSMMRCCACQPSPRPAVCLSIARTLLHQRHCWAGSGGYAAVGGGGGMSVARAHAALLLHNSLLTTLAGACGHQELLDLLLPLDAASCPALHVESGSRLAMVSGVSFDAASNDAALAALRCLEQQAPPGPAQAQALLAALQRVPLLQVAYGEQLPALLDDHTRPRRSNASAASSDGGRADKPCVPACCCWQRPPPPHPPPHTHTTVCCVSHRPLIVCCCTSHHTHLVEAAQPTQPSHTHTHTPMHAPT